MTTLPACVQTCIANTNAIASTFGCTPGDTYCLCQNANFGYAIRDCTAQACDATDAAEGITYVVSVCAAAAVGTTGSSSEVPSSSSTLATDSTITSSIGTSTIVIPSSTTPPTTYTTFTTIGVIFTTISNELQVSTYTYINTVTDYSVFTWLQHQSSVTLSIDTTNTQVSASSTATDSSGDTSRGDLSTGAKIGVGIGVSLGVLSALIIAAILLWRKRRRRDQAIRNPASDVFEAKPELHNRDLPRTHGRSELNANRAPAELRGDDAPIAELWAEETGPDTATQSSAPDKERSIRHIVT